jgi:transposase InsO family protein
MNGLRRCFTHSKSLSQILRAARPVENGFIESFNGRLRDEFLNVELLFSLADAQKKLAGWRKDFNHARPHSALADRTPSEFAALWKEKPSSGVNPITSLRALA